VTRLARARREAGETLVELLVTITIMGIAFGAILAGVGVAIASSDSHRQESTAEGVLRNYAERLTDQKDVPYVACAGPSSYAAVPPGFSAPIGWTVSITGVSYLQGDNTFGGACSPDRGAQQLTLRAESPHPKNGATEQVVIVKRKQ
jgi:type II secretory pathway pseudopilin PulG